jgi:prophage tail gpP-like protein
LIGYKAPIVKVDGKELDSALTMRINSKIFEGWEAVSVVRSIKTLCGSFTIQVSDRWRESAEAWPLRPDDETAISIGGGKINEGRVITGYIDDISPMFNKTTHRLPIEGSDKTSDMVEATASLVADKTEYKNINLTRLAQILSEPFGVSVLERANVGAPFKKWTIQQSETVFETLDRAARLRQIILSTSPVGNLILEKRGQDRSTSSLVQGINIVNGSARYSNRSRFSKYVVKGQQSGTDNAYGEVATGPTAFAIDEGVKRFRPTLIIADNPINQTDAQNLANWHATVNAAESSVLSVSTPKWLQEDGRLWQVGEIIPVTVPFLGLSNKDLLISKTTMVRSKQTGSVCHFELMRPDAFIPNKIIKKEDDLQDSLGWKV